MQEMVKGRSKGNMEQQKNDNCPVYSHKLRQKSFIKNFSMKVTGKSSIFKATYIPDYFPSLSG